MKAREDTTIDNIDDVASHQQQLYMGDDCTLEDVLCKIYHCIRPCLVGLRLPVTFVIADYLERLKLRLDVCPALCCTLFFSTKR